MQWKIWNCVMFGEFLIQIVKDTPVARDSLKFIADLVGPFIRGKIRRVLNKTRTVPFIRACLI